MDKSGKSLEQLVAFIEKLLLPEGFDLTTNEKIFDEKGEQIAELDIVISGRLGSAEIKWLIECRDRPSQGAAPISWIEQLIARRNRLNFNKLTAVSTTGFAPGAINLAEANGIDLRTLSIISEAEVKEWFTVESISVINKHSDLKHAHLVLDKSLPSEIQKQILPFFQKMDANEPFLINTDTGEVFTIGEVWIKEWSKLVHKEDNPVNKLENGAPPKGVTFEISYPYESNRYKVITGNNEGHITKILFYTEVSNIIQKVPIDSFSEYKNLLNGKQISQSAGFKFNIGEQKFEIGIHKIVKESQTQIAISYKTDSST